MNLFPINLVSIFVWFLQNLKAPVYIEKSFKFKVSLKHILKYVLTMIWKQQGLNPITYKYKPEL